MAPNYAPNTMRNKTGQRREKDMYQHVKTFFSTERGCTHVVVDLKEEKIKIRVHRNLSMREPDVTGVTPTGEVHVAEGKCFRSGESFDLVAAQAQNLSPYADYIYVFLPSEEWNQLSDDNIHRNRTTLRDRGIGLLLVDEKGKCDELLRPAPNADVDVVRKNELRAKLGLPVPEHIANPGHLSSKEADTAGKILHCFYIGAKDAATQALLNVFKEKAAKGKKDPFELALNDYGEDAPPVLVWSAHPEAEEDIYLDLDVFGGYLRDGHSCIWVGPVVSQDVLRHHLKAGDSGPGTHVWFNSKDVMYSWDDVTEDLLPKRPVEGTDTYWVVNRVDVFGRSRAGLVKELERVLRAVKKLG